VTDLNVPRQRFTELRHLPLQCELDGFVAKMRGWGFIGPEWWRNYLHIHSFYEVCYAFAGRGTFRIDQDDLPVQAGDVFVARPGQPHEIVSAADDPLGIYFWSYTLIPPASRAHGEIGELLRRFRGGTDAVNPAPAMERTLVLMTEEVTTRAPGYATVLQGLLAKLLVDTARAVTAMPEPSAAENARAVDNASLLARDIQRYLQDNYARDIAMRDIAAQVHLSERHTRRLFQQVTGRSIKSYLTQVRLQVAAQSLLDPQLSVTDVAHACGYQDVRYFVTLFRKHTGLTPAAYRRAGGTKFLNTTPTV
jgi:AraC-like DNA-binding protein